MNYNFLFDLFAIVFGLKQIRCVARVDLLLVTATGHCLAGQAYDELIFNIEV